MGDPVDKMWSAVLAAWWAVTWRLMLFAGIGAHLASRALGTADTPADGAVRFGVALVVTLWAARAMLVAAVPWSVVLAVWWAFLWRQALVGGALFVAASPQAWRWGLRTVRTLTYCWRSRCGCRSVYGPRGRRYA